MLVVGLYNAPWSILVFTQNKEEIKQIKGI